MLSVSADRPCARPCVPSGRHISVVAVHTCASPTAVQLSVPVHVTRGGLGVRPHLCLLSPWQEPGEVSSWFTDEGARAQRHHGARSHSLGGRRPGPCEAHQPFPLLQSPVRTCVPGAVSPAAQWWRALAQAPGGLAPRQGLSQSWSWKGIWDQWPGGPQDTPGPCPLP